MSAYTQTKIDESSFIRKFDQDVEPIELVWHRDERDRVVKVLEGEGWSFQFDNEIPRKLQKGDIVEINKMVYHRVIKGDTNLVLEVYER